MSGRDPQVRGEVVLVSPEPTYYATPAPTPVPTPTPVPGPILATWKYDSEILDLAFSPDGKKILVAAGDVTLIDAATGAKLATWSAAARSAAFRPKAQHIAYDSADTMVLRDIGAWR